MSSNNVRWRLTRKLVCALLILDDFTGKILTGANVRLWVPDRPDIKPVRKNDGYFLFLEGGEPLETICIEGPQYQKETIRLSERKADIKDYILKVRLSPKKGYAFQRGTTAMEGKAAPGSSLLLVCESALNQPKLMEDYKKGEDQLVLFWQTAQDIEGKRFAIKEKDADTWELLTVARKTEDTENSYTLKEPLLKAYKKTATVLLPAYHACADENGCYVLPIKEGVGKSCSCSIAIDGVNQEPVSLEIGKITTVNFSKSEEKTTKPTKTTKTTKTTKVK